jgi:multiple sugar transport system ATP-binding protein
MTVAGNMGFSLKMRGMRPTDIRERVAGTSRILGLEPYLDRYPAQLSGGQRQRVALGRAIVRNPAVFLLDEPLSNLDAQLRVDMRLELIKIQQRLGATFVFVTHDQVEAMTLANLICVMRDGKVQQTGPPEELYRKPANQFVAAFIGSPRMNFFMGRLAHGDGQLRLQVDGASIPLPTERPLAGAGERKVVLGIRPEHLQLAPAGVLEMTIEVVEALGSQQFVYGSLGPGVTIVAAVDPRSKPRVGDHLRFSIPPDDMHFFDAETGARLGG